LFKEYLHFRDKTAEKGYDAHIVALLSPSSWRQEEIEQRPSLLRARCAATGNTPRERLKRARLRVALAKAGLIPLKITPETLI
jgi:hypothetical protein